jgi:hypothetical protein
MWERPEKIDALKGRGRVRLTPEDDIEVYYGMGVWPVADGALHFEGRIEADTVTTSAIGQAKGPVFLHGTAAPDQRRPCRRHRCRERRDRAAVWARLTYTRRPLEAECRAVRDLP